MFENFQKVYSTAVAGIKRVEGRVLSQETNASGKRVVANTNLQPSKRQYVDISWLKGASESYDISPNIEDYVIVPVPIITTDVPNRNMQAWPYSEITYFDPIHGKFVYQTFTGKPTHIDHCFPGKTPIYTKNGFKKIKKIRVGDEVLTHNKRYRKVTKVYENGEKTLSSVRCQGIGGDFLVTPNHPLWVIDKRQIYNKLNPISGGAGDRRNADISKEDLKPHFRPVTDIYRGDYVITPIMYGNGDLDIEDSFAFLAGVYAAEGNLDKREDGSLRGITLTIGYHENKFLAKIIQSLEDQDVSYSVDKRSDKGVCNIRIRNEEFAIRMKDLLGEYSHNKKLSPEFLDWSSESLKVFIGGYASGDGCTTGTGSGSRLRIVTVSKILALGIHNILCSFGIPATLTRSRASTKYRHSYTIGASSNHANILNDYLVDKKILIGEDRFKQATRNLIVGDWFLTPVIKITHNVKTDFVYNIEVEEDNSYIANNIIVHNCNDNPKEAKGVILDASLHFVPKYEVGKIVVLTAWDRSKDPHLVRQILKRERDSYSMGCFVSQFVCGVCGTPYGRERPACQHQMNPHMPVVQMINGSLNYMNCLGCTFFECSSVGSPADVTAFSDELLSLSI